MTELHRHQCLIYDEGQPSHVPALARTIRENLEANNRCLLFNNHSTLTALRSWLAGNGVDVAHLISSGALSLSTDRDFLVDGTFYLEKMIELLDAAVAQALADGYAGLWASGDVWWEIGNKLNFDRVADYERRLDEFMNSHQHFSCVCLYSRNTLPPSSINTALETHPAVYVSNTLSHVNTFYRLSGSAGTKI